MANRDWDFHEVSRKGTFKKTSGKARKHERRSDVKMTRLKASIKGIGKGFMAVGRAGGSGRVAASILPLNGRAYGNGGKRHHKKRSTQRGRNS